MSQWGSFLGHADEDLLSFAWLFYGGLHVHSYYHAGQAIEKYLRLWRCLSATRTARNKWQ